MEKFNSKFRIDEFTIYKSKFWTWSVRPKQVTLGSGVLSLNRKCEQFNQITEEESADLQNIVKVIEETAKKTFNYDIMNYLMLMMDDSYVHFHVFPRYSESSKLFGFEWIDTSWPVAIQLKNLELDENINLLIKESLKKNLPIRSKYKIGYTTGVYDMFHAGHLNLLKQAKSNCDYLIVGVTSDELVAYKNTKAVINHEDRMAIVDSCKYVDKVVSQDTMDKMKAWDNYHFDVMFVGDDWKGTDTWNNLETQFSEVGVDIMYFPYTKRISSTKLREILK